MSLDIAETFWRSGYDQYDLRDQRADRPIGDGGLGVGLWVRCAQELSVRHGASSIGYLIARDGTGYSLMQQRQGFDDYQLRGLYSVA
jgi:hypothetical protein